MGAALRAGATAHAGGTYVCMEGPQFSSRAESFRYRAWGASIIGMTNMPEAKLAREAEMSYATIALATDYDCWHEEEEAVSVEAVIAQVRSNAALAQKIIKEAVPEIDGESPFAGLIGDGSHDRPGPYAERDERTPEPPDWKILVVNRPESEELFALAQNRIPGGVDSPVRAFRGVGGTPFFVEKGEGARIWDADGNAYIDYVLSWGPLILGHAHPRVVRAIQEAASQGTSFGAPTALETELAELVNAAYPSMELLRFVNSGTEATMSAIRLARGFTGRDVIVKFEGCYHGHADGLLVKAGSGGATLGVPDSGGVPGDYARNTATLPFNDIEAVRDFFANRGADVAALIIEPVAGNMGLILPEAGFLEVLREETQKAGALLIFDEVMTGFRVARGGAQALFGVTPDLTTLGKVIGGGMPVGAYGGRRDVMECVAPLGSVYQAGTLSGNPLAMTAGVETLKIIEELGLPEALDEKVKALSGGMADAARAAGVPLTGARCGSMFGAFFQEGPVRDFTGAMRSDTGQYAKFFHSMLKRGVAFAPSQFEVGFMSSAHTDESVEATLAAAREAFAEL